MPKETFYFPHDYNARNDLKLAEVMALYGLAGVGAYWCIVEMLYEEGGQLPLSFIERITVVLRADDKVIRGVIFSDLFENDSEHFWSHSVLRRLQKREEKSEKARQSIAKRWSKPYDRNTTVYEPNTIKEKKRKEKESNPLIVPPLPEWIDRAAWDGYLEMRKRKKAAPTPRAIELVIKKLTQLKSQGHDPNEVLNQSTVSAWVDVYPLKDGGRNGSNQRHPHDRCPERYTDPSELYAD